LPYILADMPKPFDLFAVPDELKEILSACPGYTVARTVDDLVKLATRDAGPDGFHEVAYDVPGKGKVVEAHACKVSNGIAANYTDPYMRRRDPDCMVIGDEKPTNKAKFADRYKKPFASLREETFAWLKTQKLAVFPFVAGIFEDGIDAVVVAPDNAGFFALGLALLQGIRDYTTLPKDFSPRTVIYVAPPFRHTHFAGKQIVVHNRTENLHELFSFNLYPGPSAKKGIYGVLLTQGEKENWVTAHCSTARIITPYGNKISIMHEGASGGGKSEMLEHAHRERDGQLLLGTHLKFGEKRLITLPRACEIHPVTDDMALCHPSFQSNDGRLRVQDAEDAWFVRVNHIERYGADPHLEEVTIHAKEPLLFLNIKAAPNATALIWEHIEDSPGKPCPNPRVVLPRRNVPHVVSGSVAVDIRSFGVRTPPCTKEKPTYGIIGLFHLLPPSLAWLWRLVAPRGHANPSIVDVEGMTSEGVGSYWPFATGRRVDQANLLLRQIVETPKVRYVLCPNQHIGSWAVSFMPQWIMREFLARRGGAKFSPSEVTPAKSPLLGYALTGLMIEGQPIAASMLQVDRQSAVGPEAYDAGAKILETFFFEQLSKFDGPDLDPLGRQIIKCCLDRGGVDQYQALMPKHSVISAMDD
jgi:Domain of unknown function (DUF4914)